MIRQVEVGGYDKNFSYIVGNNAGVALVDPSNNKMLFDVLSVEGYFPKCILITHSHHDHIEGLVGMVEKYGIPVYIHKNARGRVDADDDTMIFVKDGDKINVSDGFEIEVIHTPGHIDDAVCYYVSPQFDVENTSDGERGKGGGGALITGDTLFVEGCGRADFELSNPEDLWKSLNRLASYGDDVRVYPGHDYGSKKVSTIGWEKKHNKYLLCKDFEEFRGLRLPRN